MYLGEPNSKLLFDRIDFVAQGANNPFTKLLSYGGPVLVGAGIRRPLLQPLAVFLAQVASVIVDIGGDSKTIGGDDASAELPDLIDGRSGLQEFEYVGLQVLRNGEEEFYRQSSGTTVPRLYGFELSYAFKGF